MAKARSQRKRSRQVGSGGGGTGLAAFRVEAAQIRQEEGSKLAREGKLKPVGSTLLLGLMGRSKADVVALAAREWSVVTDGSGVLLVDGKAVSGGK